MADRVQDDVGPLVAAMPGEEPDGELSARRPLSGEGFFVRNSRRIEVVARVAFAATIITAGINHLAPGGAESYAAQVPTDGPWFSFWSRIALSNPHAFSYTISALDLALGASILLGLMRKAIYLLGVGLGVFIWAVPEGLSGLNTTKGLSASAGLLYVVGLLLLITVETTFGPDPWTLDAVLSRRHPRWSRISNFLGRSSPLPPPSYMISMAPFFPRSNQDSMGKRVSPRPPRRPPG